MIRNQIPLGRILGIPVGLDYSWFLVFALLMWLLATTYYPAQFQDWTPALYWFMGAITAISLFISVLLHELGHSVVALRFGVPVRRITLFIFGGVAQIGAEPPSAMAEFLIAVAGPLVSLALGIVFYASESVLAWSEPFLGFAGYLAYINFALVLFNLIPGYPLDGGRVFRAFVWAITKNMRRATVIAGNVGRFFGMLFIFFGVMLMFTGNFGNGIWLAFIGWFLESAATAQVQQATVRGLLAGHFVSQAMRSHCETVPAELTLQELVDHHVLEGRARCFLVNRGEDTIGMMTLHGIKEVPRSEWGNTTAAQAMLPIDRLKRIEPHVELWSALQEMDRDGVNQLPVMTDGHVVGMLSREDVISFLRTLHDLES